MKKVSQLSIKRVLYNAASMKNKCAEAWLDLGHKASKGGIEKFWYMQSFGWEISTYEIAWLTGM